MTTGSLSTIPAGGSISPHEERGPSARRWNSLEPLGCERRSLELPGFLRWKDATGAFRGVPVRTRRVSELDVLVECESPATIPLYRLVYLQIDQASRGRPELPVALRRGHVLSVVYWRGPYSRATGTPTSYAVRLLVDLRLVVGRVNREAA